MYKWNVEVILNSGKELEMYYEGNENNSLDVGKKLLEGSANNVFALCNKTNTKQFFVKIGEVSCMAISDGSV